MISVIRTLSEILTAGVAITGLSLLVYALSFNLRVRVTRSFAIMLLCVVISFAAETLGSNSALPDEIAFWQRLQWVGIIILPASYLHFSDAILALTGKPSRWRRMWLVRLAYLTSIVSLFLLVVGWLIGPLEYHGSVGFLRPTVLTNLFLVYFLGSLILSWYNLARAFRRATTSASRRRLAYLLVSSLAPALGAFPFLPYIPVFSSQHPLIFWCLAFLVNLIVGVLIVVMAYSVAFFGVGWPDRVVRGRLMKWIMRGPFTASLTLGAVTLVRRAGNVLGWNAEVLAPIVMTATILLCEHFITLLSPLGERLFFYGNDQVELETLDRLESQLVTRNDLRQFLEMVLAALSDLLQAQGGYVVALENHSSELVVSTGRTRMNNITAGEAVPRDVLGNVQENDKEPHFFTWDGDILFPLFFTGDSGEQELVGLLGVAGLTTLQLDYEQKHSLDLLKNRIELALHDRRIQQQIFASLENLSSQANLLARLRAAGRYDSEGVLDGEENLESDPNLSLWVKEALTHYWGGPRLTGSPLLRYRIVQDAIRDNDGNQANALRAVLRRAIDTVRPEGERRFTADWILYNILELKFIEGKKVREIAMRLAMSEADLYRKQRVAIETVARAIKEMETHVSQQDVETPN